MCDNPSYDIVIEVERLCTSSQKIAILAALESPSMKYMHYGKSLKCGLGFAIRIEVTDVRLFLWCLETSGANIRVL